MGSENRQNCQDKLASMPEDCKMKSKQVGGHLCHGSKAAKIVRLCSTAAITVSRSYTVQQYSSTAAIIISRSYTVQQYSSYNCIT